MTYLPIGISIFSLILSLFLIKEIKKAPSGSGKQIEIAQTIKKSEYSFLKKQYLTIGIIAFFLFFLFLIFFSLMDALGFLTGIFFSGLLFFIVKFISVSVNFKATEALKSGLSPAFDLYFKSGSVVAFSVMGLGLLIVFVFSFFADYLSVFAAFCLGVSLIAVLNRLCGGFYSKAVCLGTNLACEIKKDISKNNFSEKEFSFKRMKNGTEDCIGMTLIIFQIYTVILMTAIFLGKFFFPGQILAAVFPLYLASVGISAFIISTFFLKLVKNQNPVFSFYICFLVSGILTALGFYPIISQVSLFLKIPFVNTYLTSFIGLFLTAGLFLITDFFTSKKYGKIKSIFKNFHSDHGQNIITGLITGTHSTVLPVILISIGILISFWLAGIYGFVIAVTAMLSLAGPFISLDFYRSVACSSSRIAEMADLDEETRKKTDFLVSIDNGIKVKSYALFSAGLVNLVLFLTYIQQSFGLGRRIQFSLENPEVLAGLFFGTVIVLYLAVFIISAVSKSTDKEMEETKNRLKKSPEIVKDGFQSTYLKFFNIVIKIGFNRMILFFILPILFLILSGFILGPEFLGGLLISSIISGVFIASFTVLGEAVWENSKKGREEKKLESDNFFSFQVPITGNKIRSFAKDHIGPAINQIVMVFNIVALLIVKILL